MWHTRRRRLSLTFALVVALSNLACSKGGKTPLDNPDLLPLQVELSDGKVVFHDQKTLVASVRYRFKQGRPVPGNGLRWTVTLKRPRSNVRLAVAEGAGSGLAAEGVVQKELTLGNSRPNEPGEMVEYEFMVWECGLKSDGTVDFEARGVSNPLTGKTQIAK